MPKYATTLFAMSCLLLLSLSTSASAGTEPSIDDTVIKMPLADDVSADDAVESMKLRANTLNFKLVAYLPLYKELEGMGIKTGRVEIFQFCDARIAHAMISYDINFSAYLPCRITLIEDKEGKNWLITLDLNKIMQQADLPPDLKEKAVKVRDTIQSIMEAGANGDL